MEQKKIYSRNSNTVYMAKVISAVVAVLGIIQTVICGVNGNTFLVFVSLGYGILAIVSLLTIHFLKTLKVFYVGSLFLVYALLFVYLLTGGTEGFGILWIILFPLFFIYLLDFKPFLFVTISCWLIVAVCFLTPVYNYIYQFSDVFRFRFPLLYIAEIVFSIAVKYKVDRTEKNRAEAVKELLGLKDNLEGQVFSRTEELELQKEKIEKLTVELALSLSATIDAKDKYTSGHSKRVAEYSQLLAKQLGKNEDYQKKIYLTALLHDIGKIGVPDEIINKPSKLTDLEYDVIKKHPEMGNDILNKITSMPEIVIGVRWHHERFDGKGYPDGLKGNEIPEYAQIISVADAYDAMTSTRSYRSVLPQSAVREQIEKGLGKQFAPDSAKAMLDIIDADKEYKLHG